MKRMTLTVALFAALVCSSTPAMARHGRYYPYVPYGGYNGGYYGYYRNPYFYPRYGYGYGSGPIFDARAFGYSTFGF